MKEPTKEELLEFMRKNYGESWATADKLELAKLLWQKRYGGRYVVDSDEYPKVKICDLQRGARFSVEGIVINVEKSQYQGCPICKRSVRNPCEHIKNKQTSPVFLTRMVFTVSDGTGEVKVDGVFTDDAPDVQLGDLVLVKGFVSTRALDMRMVYNGHDLKKRIESNGSSENNVQEVVVQNEMKKVDPLDDFGWSDNDSSEIVMPHKIYNILQFIKRVGSMAESPLKRMAKHEGIEWDELVEYLEVNDGKYKVKSDIGLNKVKLR